MKRTEVVIFPGSLAQQLALANGIIIGGNSLCFNKHYVYGQVAHSLSFLRLTLEAYFLIFVVFNSVFFFFNLSTIFAFCSRAFLAQVSH